jgi:hypothetical protein
MQAGVLSDQRWNAAVTDLTCAVVNLEPVLVKVN